MSTMPDIYLLIYLLTYLLTPWSRVLLEKLTGSQLVKKFPALYGTRRFITAFTSARRLSLSRASLIQSMPPHPTSLSSIVILSFHLRLDLPSGLFPSGFPTKILYTPLLSPMRATCPAHLIFLDFITRTYDARYRRYVHCMLTESMSMCNKKIPTDKHVCSRNVCYFGNARNLWFMISSLCCHYCHHSRHHHVNFFFPRVWGVWEGIAESRKYMPILVVAQSKAWVCGLGFGSRRGKDVCYECCMLWGTGSRDGPIPLSHVLSSVYVCRRVWSRTSVTSTPTVSG